jgi:hypothetical protein
LTEDEEGGLLTKGERVDRMGLLIGAAVGVAVMTIVLNFAGGEGWIRETWPLPRWTFAVPIAALVTAAAIWAVRSPSPWIATLAVALGILGTGTGVLRIGDADPQWARVLQGVGLAMLRPPFGSDIRAVRPVGRSVENARPGDGTPRHQRRSDRSSMGAPARRVGASVGPRAVRRVGRRPRGTGIPTATRIVVRRPRGAVAALGGRCYNAAPIDGEGTVSDVGDVDLDDEPDELDLDDVEPDESEFEESLEELEAAELEELDDDTVLDPAVAEEAEALDAPEAPADADEADDLAEVTEAAEEVVVEDDAEEGLREGEFICASCYLAKGPTQLANAKRSLCVDCV